MSIEVVKEDVLKLVELKIVLENTTRSAAYGVAIMEVENLIAQKYPEYEEYRRTYPSLVRDSNTGRVTAEISVMLIEKGKRHG